MSDMMNYGHGFGMSGMWFLPVLFWLLVIVGAFLVLRGLLDKKSEPGISSPAGNEPPLKILQTRFAKGDIDEDTFKRMKKELEE